MDTEKVQLKTEPIWKLMLKYCIPAVIGMVVNGLYTVVDRIFIGHIPEIGALAMIGLGVSFPMVQIINSFGMLLAVGGATAISLKLGQDNREHAEKILGNVLSLTFLLGMLLSVIGLTFMSEILMLFGATEETLSIATSYMNILMAGTVFALYGSVFGFLIRGDGNPKLSAILMVVSCIMNIMLDGLFIFGMNLGMEGAAYATVLSQCMTTIVGFSYYLRKKSNLELKRPHLKVQIPYLKEILFIGSAPFCTQIAGSITQIVTNNVLLAQGGDLAIGALSTMMSVMFMFGMPIMGLTTGIQPIVSYNFGAGEFARVKEVIRLSSMVATGFLLLVWGIILSFPELLVGMFNSDPELMEMTVDGMKKYFLMFPLLGVTYVGTNFIQSTGNAKVALLLSLMRQFLFLIPLLLIFPRFWGLNGIWYTQPVADLLSGVVSVTVMLHTIRGYGATFEQGKTQKASTSNE